MYCSNCRRQIPDSSKFCNFCGGEQLINTGWAPESEDIPSQTEERPVERVQAPPRAEERPLEQAQSPGPQAETQPEPKKSSTAKRVISWIIYTVIGLVVIYSIGHTIQERIGDRAAKTTAAAAASAAPKLDSLEYSRVFTDNNIIRVYAPLSGSGSTEKFAKDCGDYVENLIFRYNEKTDAVLELMEIAYYSVDGLSENELDMVREELKRMFAAYEASPACEVRYELTSNQEHMAVVIHVEKMDERSTIQELKALGMEFGGAENAVLVRVSMKETIKSMVSNGYVQA